MTKSTPVPADSAAACTGPFAPMDPVLDLLPLRDPVEHPFLSRVSWSVTPARWSCKPSDEPTPVGGESLNSTPGPPANRNPDSAADRIRTRAQADRRHWSETFAALPGSGSGSTNPAEVAALADKRLLEWDALIQRHVDTVVLRLVDRLNAPS